jgi:hypothetical protein
MSDFQVIRDLKIQPKSGTRIEIPCQPKSGIGADAAAFVNNLSNSRHRHAKIKRQPVHAEPQRHHKFRAQNFTGVNGRKKILRFSHCSSVFELQRSRLRRNLIPLVIVHYLGTIRVPLAPHKTEPPLVVNSDTVLSLSLTVQCF